MKNSFQWQFVDNFDFPLKIQSSYCLQIVGDHKINYALNIWSTDNKEIAEVDNSDSALTIQSKDKIQTAVDDNSGIENMVLRQYRDSRSWIFWFCMRSRDNMETACRSVIIPILHWQSDQIQRLHAADYAPNSVLKIWFTDNLKTAGVDNSDSALTIRSNDNIETAGVNNHDSAVEINHVKDNTETV